ncbi:hypothetical protein HN747_01395 [archaeon]|jgi:tRNA-uridine 2-sulfurtransferase|nr:hypothetical protein [archaeon]
MGNKEKVLVLYSGGLDSRLVVKLLQEQGKEIEAFHFKLPFGCGCCDLGCNFNFTQKESVKMTIMDATRGELLDEYLEILKNPKHGTGAGINPCRDCKIWMFSKAKEYADKAGIEKIATGEVLGQRPMSQTGYAMKLIDKEIGFTPLRPLMEEGITGRSRKKQMEMAEKYKITYPTPGGGCLLCDKILSKRLKLLMAKNLLNQDNIFLTNVGRHFMIDGVWFIVARDSNESKVLETFDSFIPDEKGKPTIFYNSMSGMADAKQLQEAYRSGAEKIERDKFMKFKI